MDFPTPTDAHRALAPLAGDWIGDETCYPSPWNPELQPATGHNRMRVALGGFAVISEYEQVKQGEVTFTGHGVYGYDPDEAVYTCYWFDSMNPKAALLKGQLIDGVLTMTSHDPQFGYYRLIYDLRELGEGRHGFRLEGSQDGEQWQVMQEATYRLAEQQSGVRS